MKLFKLSQDINCGYDTFNSVIVVAENEEKAKRIHPYMGCFNVNYDEDKKEFWNKRKDGSVYLFEDNYGTWTNDLSKIKVQYLGEADMTLKEGVILASFNAG